jgi:DUF971 family protein
MLEFIPETITHDHENLHIKWKDGKECSYNLLMLRKYCPCAECRGGHDVDSVRTTDSIERIEFVSYRKIGRYAIQIVWSDRHDLGMYAFEDLRKACDLNHPYGE